ncbi:unnamed protein product [Urochloa decumbens]|uniref:DUF4220 domain-containing protein n=1 Tax=Urochloa decumbens TaxID=240449 RepID=A0ABC9D8V3_9POAL
MSLPSVVQWWEEWQLRILVLGSLCIQCYLSFFAPARKRHIKPLFRFSIWLAYLGGDALAIYALATLFNRQRKVRYSSASGSHDLEVLWAPILLMHLGGQITISAYNIEDNELWTRHTVTAVSQVAVALYVFCKSWSPSADGRPLALKTHSFDGLVNSFNPSARTETTNREVELERYIQDARVSVHTSNKDSNGKSRHVELLSEPDMLFVDFAHAYTYRTTKLKSFWSLDNQAIYEIYTILAMFVLFFLLFFATILPIVAIGLFHSTHKEAYRGSDIKVTFALLYITYLLEIASFITATGFQEVWPDVVAQHSLIGFLVHNRRHTKLMGMAQLLQCKGLLDTYFCIKPCDSSKHITDLVQEHVKDGWMNYITDVESYWKFNDIRGHWTLERNGCDEGILRGSIEKPFDESTILWHLATDLCFHRKVMPSDLESATLHPQEESETDRRLSQEKSATLCRAISNYMMHLLFSNPEMLMPGSRRKIFTAAYEELEAVLQGDDLSLLDEKEITLKISEKIELAKNIKTGENMKPGERIKFKEGFTQDAWDLAQELIKLGDKKMWEVIKGVWIEMLCFSAGRCRGYLHAKSLGLRH